MNSPAKTLTPAASLASPLRNLFWAYTYRKGELHSELAHAPASYRGFGEHNPAAWVKIKVSHEIIPNF